MKHLYIRRLEYAHYDPPINQVSFLLDTVSKNVIDQKPWDKYNYCPGVQFAMAYGNDAVFLKYYVNEKFVRAAHGAINTAVYEDTCVEFFVSFGEDDNYYNFECNCIGTILVGYGGTKKGRQLLHDGLISKIKYQSVINNEHPGVGIHWEITLAIPLEVFCHHQFNGIQGRKCRANFYKCGDHLPIPHFISWSNIISPEPDFHLPEFFGTLDFV